jgi:hypothetical protein
MKKYKIMFTFFAILAMMTCGLGYYYTIISTVPLFTKIFIYIILACEIIADVIIIKVVTKIKNDD